MMEHLLTSGSSHLDKIINNQPDSPERRNILKQMAVAAALAATPLSSVFAVTQDQDLVIEFLEVSSFLTGIELDRSYMQLGHDILQLLFLTDFNFNPYHIRQLSAEIQHNHTLDPFNSVWNKLAHRTLFAWYLGQIEISPKYLTNANVQRICSNLRGHTNPKPLLNDNGSITAMISYDEALVWQACDFTKPSATCGGPFGYWANPPATKA